MSMPLLVVFLVALAVFGVVAFATWHYPTPLAEPTPSLGAAKAVGKEIGHHSRLRRALKNRLNPEAATGLALTIGLVLVLAGGLAIGLLAYLVRSNATLVDIDASVAAWGDRHSGPVSEKGLNAITQLGGTYLVIGLAVIVAIVGYVRRPNRWIPVFLLTVLLGQVLLSNVIKELLDRARPTFNPIAETLGPSFPSGHSTAAAAFWAAAALVLGRGTSPKTRALLAGGAAGIAVAVASTRVLLDVHWLSDVLAGLALGWAWFALCSIAFGGRFLRFGAAAEKVVREADAEARTPAVERAA